MTLYPRDSGPGGIISLFCASSPVSLLSLGILGLFSLPMPRSPDRPGAYLVSFPLCAPLSRSSRGLFGFFTSLRPALPIGSGLIWLLFLFTPRSPDRLGAYLASFPLCAPPSRSSQGLFGFFSSLRPTFPIFPGLILFLCLSVPRSLDLPGAYFSSCSTLRPCTQKSASDNNIVMRQTAFCTYSLHCFFT